VRAQALAGCQVGELAAALGVPLPEQPRRAKGFVGQLVELALGADPLAYTRPDFPDLGVELKTLPVNACGVPSESTFCCSIAMADAAHAHWESARLRHRLGCVLWLPVHSAAVAQLCERRFGRALLWEPSDAQWQQLRADWEELMGSIGAGLGGQLSARIGVILQVRPKAAHAQVRCVGEGPDGLQSLLPLAFYLRRSFTATLVG
jgi:DNA mismatch repair protein MutH